MTQLQDIELEAALESQYSQLAGVLDRLEAAQRTLVPGPAGFWSGSARQAFDSAVSSLATSLESSHSAVRSARDATQFALVQVRSRV